MGEMVQRTVYLCTVCPDPCIAVTDGIPEGCMTGGRGESWIRLDPLLAAGLLSGAAEEQREWGRR